MLRTKAWFERGLALFLLPQLRREGGETLGVFLLSRSINV